MCHIGATVIHKMSIIFKKIYIKLQFLLERHYASMMWLSVCLSQVPVLSKSLDRLSWFLAWRVPLTYPPTDQVSTKIRVVLPSETSSQTQDLENFTMHRRLLLQRVVNLAIFSNSFSCSLPVPFLPSSPFPSPPLFLH